MVVQFKLTKTEYKPENIIQNEVTIIDKLSLPDAADAIVELHCRTDTVDGATAVDARHTQRRPPTCRR